MKKETLAKYSDTQLRHIRRTLESEMLAAVKSGVTPTQAHVGQLELLQAVGEELYNRGALLPPPPFVDVCHENGIRHGITVRVW